MQEFNCTANKLPTFISKNMFCFKIDDFKRKKLKLKSKICFQTQKDIKQHYFYYSPYFFKI
jgi:hypothetical protein